MAKEKNIEEIRQKNLKDNQSFLKKLGINDIRKDLAKSTRSISPKTKTKTQYEKVERVTRYSLKVQSGEIKPYIPLWQRKKAQLSQWTLMYENNRNPYALVYKPRVRN